MEETKCKKQSDANKEKNAFSIKKKNLQEKKTKSDTLTAIATSNAADRAIENIIIVGKSCTFTKSKSHESYYRLHECPSETSILQPLDTEKLPLTIPTEGLQQTNLAPTQSDASFISAESEISPYSNTQKKNQEQENMNNKVDLENQPSNPDDSIGFKTVFTETDLTFGNVEDIELQFKEMEKQAAAKEKKIKDLNLKIDECCKNREIQKKENQGLSHEINLLNRQLHSMYELMGKKNWNDSIDPAEFIRYKNKAVELEGLIIKQESDKTELKRRIKALSSDLESKEKELNAKNRELVECKNRNTLEICKLMNQIDGLERKLKSQSQVLTTKIFEAEDSMDNEIVNITKKLEEQYQKDLASALDKLHSHFEQLASLPKSAIEKLLQFFEPNKVDFISALKDWDRQESFLQSRILSMQADHSREMLQLKDSYESKIIFLKTQVESLSSQLKERKEILDIFESELMTYKSNSSMNLLRASSKADDITSLKELYTTEIFSQKQVHKLEMDIFEEKVKTLSEEILYYAKNEEIHLHELENAKKMAFTFREKYEQLVLEWEERVDKDFKLISSQAIEKNELDSICQEFKSLMSSLNKSQEVHEEKIKKFQASHEDQLSSCKRDMEVFRNKLEQLEVFQNAQSKLDEKIQELIKSIGINYNKTIEALETKHAAELSLKQLEMCSSEKRYSDEINNLKKNQEKEVVELRKRLQHLENSKMVVERELDSLRKNCESKDVNELKVQAEKMSLELLKSESMIAMKEEAEQALNDRIKELEKLIREKEENCRRELEDLVAKLLKVNVLSSAKDELIKELEDKLNDSEKLLQKSVHEVDKVCGLCSRLEESTTIIEDFHTNDGGDFENDSKIEITDANAKIEKLRIQVSDVFEKLEFLEKENGDGLLVKEKILMAEKIATEDSKKCKKLKEDLKTMTEKNVALEEKIMKALEQNNKLIEEKKALSESLEEKEKIIKNLESERDNLSDLQEKHLLEGKTEIEKKLESLETEKNQLIFREESLFAERDELLERNRVLEENVNSLNEKVNLLMKALEHRAEGTNEVFSISLQEVRVLYQEEQETVTEVENKTSTTTVGCQVELSESLDCLRPEEDDKEREGPRAGIGENDVEFDLGAVEGEQMVNTKFFYEDVIKKFKNIQNELSEVINERNELLAVSEGLEKERDSLKEECLNLRDEINALQASYAARLKLCEEKGCCSFKDDASNTGCKVDEMSKEIGKLGNYIKTLSKKLDEMKASNENLLSESTEHLRQNQSLINELEEAWSQRYEIEDQLTKVRKENALLNMHRSQLEETNRRISNLIAEGKPSAVTWIKIHETVENIVDEVVALKTSFSDLGSISGAECGVPKTESELKLMQETLHVQLQNKTILCDELLVQKATLEKELKTLEDLLHQNDSRIMGRRLDGASSERDLGVRKRHLDGLNQHTSSCPLTKQPVVEYPELYQNPEASDSETHLFTLNKLKKHLENQAELEEAQFRESLEFEIEGLKKMQNSEGNDGEINDPFGTTNEEENLELIEMKYEEEIKELSREFESEVEKLRVVFLQDKDEENCQPLTEELQGKYAGEIEKLRFYFEKKWADLENRYQKIYINHRQKRLNYSLDRERELLISRFQKLFDGQEESKESQKSRIESFLKEILNRYIQEIKLVQQKYQEGLSELEKNHTFEVRKLESVIAQLQENLVKIKSLSEKESEEDKYKVLVESIQVEYEEKLENEKKKFSDMLEEARQEHEKEILALEEFWTEKLSECETKCALIKATAEKEDDKKKKECEKKLEDDRPCLDIDTSSATEQSLSKRSKYMSGDVISNSGLRSIEKFKKDSQNFLKGDFCGNQSLVLDEEKKSEESFCLSCLSNQTYLGRMEVKTDDDKLEIVRERDELKDMVSSLRFIVGKLLSLVGQYGKELNNSSLKDFDVDDTLYKSIQIDLDQTRGNVSAASNSVHLALDLSTIIQEINDNSLLNSSDQVRFELETCLKQLKKDAAGLLALSCPSQDHLNELIKKLEREKNELEVKVRKVEETQDEMQKEIVLTKDKLAQWERNLEVISEGYGEELVQPKKLISLSELKDKLKLLSEDHYIQPSQDLNLLEEICKEGDRLQDEWKRERLDLQQQIDVADKQLHSLRKFLEEQAAEREQEREAFDREINKLKEDLKAKERDNSLKNRTNTEVEVLEGQLKELSNRLNETERNKGAIEGEFQNAVKKIWSLREVIQDLEVQLAEVSERELNLKKEIGKLDTLLDEQIRFNRELKEELEYCRSQGEIKYSEHIKNLEEELLNLRRVAEQINPETLTQMKTNLREIEAILVRKTKDLEQLHTSSANVSCSSPSEDVSLRDQLDATRCSTPDEMFANTQQSNVILPLEEVDRIHEKLTRHTRAEEVATKYIRDLKMQLRNYRKSFDEIQTERDVLLERVDLYLKENSSLKVRLEEQRCNAGLLQKQLNADLESQINRLEIDVEKLNELCIQKDKQLSDMKVILENTTKSLKMRETEVLNKSKEENTLISNLKTDLANALDEKQKLEESLEKMKDKLREQVKMPTLIDSMLEEKNAEIDRLEKEVARLSCEKSVSFGGRSFNNEYNSSKTMKRIKFSEPDSFGECISSISGPNPSTVRNITDSFTDMRNSSLKLRQPLLCSPKLESMSSIGPLQLSPRGTETCCNWKTSSPIMAVDGETKIQPRSLFSKNERDFQQLVEEANFQSKIESKQREISELKLEIDVLKRQLVEVNEKLESAKCQTKEIQNDLFTKDEEIRKLKNNEKSLLITVETLKKNHEEEVEELQNKVSFERRKVEKVYEEIKALEVKKIEIEEAFYSLKEDYTERVNAEQKKTETLFEEIKDLEMKKTESEEQLAIVKEDLGKMTKELKETTQKSTKDISDLKKENESLKTKCEELLKCCNKVLTDAGIQVEIEGESSLNTCELQIPQSLELATGDLNPLGENLKKLKDEVEKMGEAVNSEGYNKREASAYVAKIRSILSCVLGNTDEIVQELETHRKRIMECSVDDLACKVQRELLLSAKLDNKLLSSIGVNGFGCKDSTDLKKSVDGSFKEFDGGDSTLVESCLTKTVDNENFLQSIAVRKEITEKLGILEREKLELEEKISDQENIIDSLKKDLLRERERVFEEKGRCSEDAKIMELLRVNLEKGLQELRSKDKDLKKEKQQRISLEKELEVFKKTREKDSESKKLAELISQLESSKSKLAVVNRALEEEKKKNQELRLLLEQNRIERASEKGAQKLLESDLSLLREQKEKLKAELINASKMLNTRNAEIGLLKRKINLQEIDIKALNLGNDLRLQTESDASSVMSKTDVLPNPSLACLRKGGMTSSLLDKMRKLNSCVQRHVQESNEMGEALLYLSRETEQMKGLIEKLEEDAGTNGGKDALIEDLEVERKLWDLEKGRLVMDVENLRGDYEVLKRHSLDTYKNNEILKLENSKLKAEIKSLQKEIGGSENYGDILQDRVAHLMGKYLRAESYRKALSWQKQYLVITLNGHRASEEEAWKKLGKLSGKRKALKAGSKEVCKKFRVVAFTVMAIFRMRYIVKRWQKNRIASACLFLGTRLESKNHKQNPLASILNIYSEPINPLSYQTQNIFHEPTSMVLRTPPSRDPGSKNYHLDAETVSKCLETVTCLQENVGTAQVAP